MRILHTADWHVGKRIRGLSRLPEQAQVLGEIVEITRGQAVDLVLIAGDLFDTAMPTPEASGLVYRTLLGLRAAGAQVVVVAGNHDNQAGIDALRPLLAEVGVTALGQAARPDAGGVVELSCAGERAVVALLPFLSKRYVVRADALMAHDAADHNATYDDRVRRILSALCAGFHPDAVNLVVAHCMVRGGKLGGGERDAQTIFEYSTDATAFPATAHYIALGHLHRFQQVGGTLPAYYSGAPLQVDFGESEDTKGVVLVDAEPGAPARVRFQALTAGRRLRTVRGSLPELAALARTFGEDLLRVVVSEPRRAGLAEEVREVLPNAVEVRIDPELAQAEAASHPPRSGRSAVELFADFLVEKGYNDPRLNQLFAELYEQVGSSS